MILRTDIARELVDPASPIATPTLLGGRSFAYLIVRQVDSRADTYEFGVYAHGPAAADLATVMVDKIRAWVDRHRRGPAARIGVYPAVPIDHDEFSLDVSVVESGPGGPRAECAAPATTAAVVAELPGGDWSERPYW